MSLNRKMENIPSGKLMLIVGTGAFLALLPAWINYDIISRDGAFQYVPAAKVFLSGNFREGFLRPELPLFPLIIAGITKLTGFSLEFSGRVASYLAFVLAAIGMFKVGEVLFKNRGIALLAVLFLITNREFVDCSVDCLKEALLICCILWGNYLILKGIAAAGEKHTYYILGTITLLAGALFRSTALVFLCAWIIIWVFYKKEERFIRAALFLIPVTLVLVIWVINPDLPIFRKSFQFGYFFISSHSAMDIFKSSVNVIMEFFSRGNAFIILFGLFGLYHYTRDYYYMHVCLVLGMFFLILIMWLFASGRYFLAPISWIYPLAAYAVARTFRLASNPLKAIAFLTVVSAIVLWADVAFTPPDQDKLARKDAGEWILASLGQDQEIISNRDRLVFYAQGSYIPLSDFQETDLFSRVIAIDTMLEDAKLLQEKIRSRGIIPDKQFRSISVYLATPPGS